MRREALILTLLLMSPVLAAEGPPAAEPANRDPLNQKLLAMPGNSWLKLNPKGTAFAGIRAMQQDVFDTIKGRPTRLIGVSAKQPPSH